MKAVELSVVIPVGSRVDALDALHRDYRRGLDACGLTYEMVYVLDGRNHSAWGALSALRDGGEPVRLVRLGKSFGEATALMVGFANARGTRLMTLPAYFQVDAAQLPKLLEAGQRADLVIARRWPRREAGIDRFRRSGFHALLRGITGESFRDLGCGVRLMSRRVAKEINIYGDQHRLLPVLAARQGFEVVEVDLAQSDRDHFRGHYRAREYVHRVLDLFTVFFLVRFTKKPLRFFGMIGSGTFALGALVVGLLVAQRLLLDQPLADRPALLLGCLMLVLGVQLFALGLLGELIIFTHARDLKDYRIADVVDATTLSRRRATEAAAARVTASAEATAAAGVHETQALDGDARDVTRATSG